MHVVDSVDKQSPMKKKGLALGKRVRAAREALGLSQAELAQRIGMTQTGVASIEAGDVARPKKMFEIARALSLPVEQLLGDTSAPPQAVERIRPPEGAISETQITYDFPVYAAIETSDGYFRLTPEPIETQKIPSILEGVRGAYGLVITGETMFPEFRHGDMALIHPGLPKSRGEAHVFYDRKPILDAKAMVKTLVDWSGTELMMEQYNPSRKWTESATKWQVVHVILGRFKHLR